MEPLERNSDMQSAEWTRLDTSRYQLGEDQQIVGAAKDSIFSPTRYSPSEEPLPDSMDTSHSDDASHVDKQTIPGHTKLQGTSPAVRGSFVNDERPA
jgi:hypothetical protein